jgi:hypothetical protein
MVWRFRLPSLRGEGYPGTASRERKHADCVSHVTPGLQEAAAARFDEALTQNQADQGLSRHDPIEVD